MKRVVIAVMFVLTVACLFAASSYGGDAESIPSPKLKKKVVVRYDDYGVPHIKAENFHDLFFVQGYVTAKDRLFEMDYFRRRAYGRMAELEGESAVEDDLNVRKMQFEKVSRLIYEKAKPELKLAVESFAEGVNFYIDTHADSLPEEFTKLSYKPDAWQPWDSLAFGRVVSYQLSADLGEELGLWLMKLQLGNVKFHEILDGMPADPITIVHEQKQSLLLPPAFKDEALAMLAQQDKLSHLLGDSPFVGSNNWTVSGKKTTTGFPVVCNDPHMGIQNPSIWYEVHLQAPGINVIGTTFPGSPGVIIGHNENIAWGVTTTGYDVSDVYVEKLNPKNTNEYMFQGKYLPITEEKTVISYRTPEGMKTKDMTIRYTVHGPIVREKIDVLPGVALSFKWTGFEPTFEAEAFAKVDMAKNLKEFKEALKSFGVGAQNFVYGDTKGNIFYMAPGLVPIRPKNAVPYLPMDGTGGYEWEGFIPYDKLPQVENPADGFIATANDRPITKDYPYYIGILFDIGYRHRRIATRLEEKQKLSFEEVQAVQGDHVVLSATHLKPFILEAAERNKQKFEKFKDPIAALKNWDDACTVDSVACSIFFKWLKYMSIRTLKDDIGKGKLGERLYNEFVGRAEVIELLLLQAQRGNLKSDWFDDSTTPDVKETQDDMVYLALSDAVDELVKQFGDNMDNWTWGKLHGLKVSHWFISDDPKRNLGPFPRWGGQHTVDAAGFGLLGDEFNFGSGPSLRICHDVQGKIQHAENVLPGGESSDPASPHFDDQLKLWLQNKTRPMYFSEEDVSKHTEQTATFTP